MGPDSLLKTACERAFAVARTEFEANPSVEPPEAMKSFLYVARLPRRAISVAHSVIESDPVFRKRVASSVTREDVGDVGFLWLSRPAGWEVEIDKLKKSDSSETLDNETGSTEPTIPPPPGFNVSQFVGDSSTGVKRENENDFDDSEVSSEVVDADAIEQELSSLRGLVDRLATERSSVEGQAHGAMVGGKSFKQDLSAMEASLDQVRSELETVVKDRDEARRKHSESLTQQLELEKELARHRSNRTQTDSVKAESETKLTDARKELARITAGRDEVERQRQALVTQTNELNHELGRVRSELKQATITLTQKDENISQRDKSLQEALDQKALVDERLNQQVAANEDLKSRLSDQDFEIERLRVELDGFADVSRRADTLQREVDEFQEKVAAREQQIKDKQAEVEQKQLDVLRLSNDLAELRNERDDMATQVSSLQTHLEGALSDMGSLRQSSDQDRDELTTVQQERDDLNVEIVRLREVENERRVQIDTLMAEQSEYVASKQRNIEFEERITGLESEILEFRNAGDKLRSDLAEANAKLDAHNGEIFAARAELESAETKMAQLKKFRDEAQASLEDTRVERETLVTKLAETEQLYAESDAQRAKAQDQLSEALSNLGTVSAEIEARRKDAESATAKLGVEQLRVRELQAALDLLRDENGQPQGKELAQTDRPNSQGSDSSVDNNHQKTAKQSAGIVETELQQDSGTGVLEREDTVAVPAVIQEDNTGPVVGHVQPKTAAEPEQGSQIFDDSGVAALIRSVPPQPPQQDGTADVSATDVGSIRPPSVLTGESAPQRSGDELDKVSDLLSEKLTTFDSGSSEKNVASSTDADSSTENSPFFGDRSATEGQIGRPPSVFGKELSADDADEDADVTMQPSPDVPISSVAPVVSLLPSSTSGGAVVDRKQIEIPAEVQERGGVDLARFVVESPEVVLLVDGDGVAKLGWASRSVAERRDALIAWLADLTASSGASSDVVFDGRSGDDSALRASRVVGIRLSTPPTGPSVVLDELVDAYPPQFPIAVVSDNPSLRESVGRRGAVALSNAQLLDLFMPE